MLSFKGSRQQNQGAKPVITCHVKNQGSETTKHQSTVNSALCIYLNVVPVTLVTLIDIYIISMCC